MNLWKLAIHLNILNISKDCQRICSDFIFTAVCCMYGFNLKLPVKIDDPMSEFIAEASAYTSLL